MTAADVTSVRGRSGKNETYTLPGHPTKTYEYTSSPSDLSSEKVNNSEETLRAIRHGSRDFQGNGKVFCSV